MQWWCAATNVEWSWTWRAYPGVWLMIALLAALFVVAWRGTSREAAWRRAAAAAGVLLLWAALDWPLGALGAGYLLSLHTVQYVVITMAAMPLLLMGTPRSLWPVPQASPGRALRLAAHPAVGLALYVGAMAVTHVPSVSDTLMRSQPGSLAVDLLWMLGAFGLWWPVLAPPGLGRISEPLKVGYLFLATIPPTVPAMFMVFADFPLYGLYELAPRVQGIGAAADQQVAGLIMKIGAEPFFWIAMAIVFFRWYQAEERQAPGHPKESTG